MTRSPRCTHCDLFLSLSVDSFTGAYVFYWLLLLLLYMCAYFISTKSDTSDSRAVAQVLRQLVAFLIASKGYLDYVIWFAVNSIERYVTLHVSLSITTKDIRHLLTLPRTMETTVARRTGTATKSRQTSTST